MTTVPSPREVLTSIINTLSAFDPAQNAQVLRQTTTTTHRHGTSTTGATGTGSPANPLNLIPNSHRALLTTLHVLYPSTLLPALDLLDRKLVKRVTVANPAQPNPHDRSTATHPEETLPPHEQTRTEEEPARAQAQAPSPKPSQTRTFYLVRSAQPQSTHHRRRRENQASASASTTAGGPSATASLDTGGPSSASVVGGGKLYVVGLDAWNCSCAAFAFSAFPPEQRVSSDTDKRLGQQDFAPDGGDAGGGGRRVEDDRDSVNTSLLTKLRGEAQEAENISDSTTDGKNERKPYCGYDILPAAVRKGNLNNNVEEVQYRAGIIDHDADWEFGGFSIDGLEGSGISSVPCCKHLLACLLGERWNTVLGSFIEDRVVSREEAAGLLSDT